MHDGDLLRLVQFALVWRGRGLPRFPRLRVVLMMPWSGIRLGNDAAEEAAEFGRRRLGCGVLDARRCLREVSGRWYSVVCGLHHFFIAFSRAVVNEDGQGGTAIHPVVWSVGSVLR